MKATASLLLSFLALLNVHGQTLIPNGSFESAMTGWTTVGSVEALGPPRTSMAVGTDGTRAAALGTFDSANASMSQVLYLSANQDYRMTFDLLASGVFVGGLTGSVQVLLWDGVGTIYSSNQFTSVSAPVLHNGAEGFEPQQFFFSLPAGITDATLTFTDVSPNGGGHVDPIIDTIRVTAVPEPQACLLLLVGLPAMIGWRGRLIRRA